MLKPPGQLITGPTSSLREGLLLISTYAWCCLKSVHPSFYQKHDTKRRLWDIPALPGSNVPSAGGGEFEGPGVGEFSAVLRHKPCSMLHRLLGANSVLKERGEESREKGREGRAGIREGLCCPTSEKPSLPLLCCLLLAASLESRLLRTATLLSLESIWPQPAEPPQPCPHPKSSQTYSKLRILAPAARSSSWQPIVCGLVTSLTLLS